MVDKKYKDITTDKIYKKNNNGKQNKKRTRQENKWKKNT